ncbi:glycosyltransferase family 4 protein [Bacillus sp. E(2018)]|uniref:glycosyltransferase family 4 protein n=1 Tax=Bacillus sp. E(2018) TaxID=2502239 RepID=UPI0010F76324|nr:glycosyltransferase family 4 protein [Bacillus sp. E(2018)]
MKKILIVSTVSRQFYLFEQGNIEVLKSLGFEVHAAANFSDANKRLDALEITRHHFDIQRSPISLKNLKAYRQLLDIMKSEKFDVIHCHSPMGGVITRIAAKFLSISPVIYTAHGFHFYKGAPIINWAIYYPVEWFLSKYTNHIITINMEDFNKAKEFKADRIHYVPGIGVDTSKFNKTTITRNEKRNELGVSENTIVLLSIGEMIKRKNHETALRALAKLENQNFVYLICGKGELEGFLKNLAVSLGIQEKVRFLGFRNDVNEICIASDVLLFPSYQEGLPVSVMEGMAAGLPIVCSEIRGNTDLVEDGIGGYLLKPNDIKGFSQAIDSMITSKEKRRNMGKYNQEKVLLFDKGNVKKIMNKLYGQWG